MVIHHPEAEPSVPAVTSGNLVPPEPGEVPRPPTTRQPAPTTSTPSQAYSVPADRGTSGYFCRQLFQFKDVKTIFELKGLILTAPPESEWSEDRYSGPFIAKLGL